MQIRELNLTELDIAFELISQLYPTLSYDEYEDLIYQMQDKKYKIFGLFEKESLLCYAGVSVDTTLIHKRHLYIHDLVTTSSRRFQGLSKEMLIYLRDYAKMLQCESLITTTAQTQFDAHQLYINNGFDEQMNLLVKPL